MERFALTFSLKSPTLTRLNDDTFVQTVPSEQPKHVSKRSCACAPYHVWCSKKFLCFAIKTTTKRTFVEEIRVHKLEVFRLFRNVLCGENDRLRNDGRCQHLEAADEEEEDVSSSLSSSPSSLKKLRNGNPARTVEMLERRIADEFRMKEYIWTGDIDVDLFSLKCVFTDPTLSFTGLETFRDNLESLQPSLRRIAPEGKRRVELRECGKDEDSTTLSSPNGEWSATCNCRGDRKSTSKAKLDFSFGEREWTMWKKK